MSPTTSPNFEHLTEYGSGCPEDYSRSNHYETGDIVSYAATQDRKVVYQCKVRIVSSMYCFAIHVVTVKIF
jgi:hypothetical protein